VHIILKFAPRYLLKRNFSGLVSGRVLKKSLTAPTYSLSLLLSARVIRSLSLFQLLNLNRDRRSLGGSGGKVAVFASRKKEKVRGYFPYHLPLF